MTALKKFLKQIVLKQVNGSVYLVPAICDTQIKESLEEERKQLSTPCGVDTESELLAFSKFLLNRSYVRGNYYPETLVKLFKDNQLSISTKTN